MNGISNSLNPINGSYRISRTVRGTCHLFENDALILSVHHSSFDVVPELSWRVLAQKGQRGRMTALAFKHDTGIILFRFRRRGRSGEWIAEEHLTYSGLRIKTLTLEHES